MRRVMLYVCVWVAVALAGEAPSAAPGDLVLYASDAVNRSGNWALASDSTTRGQVLSSIDRNWSTANAPLAAPADSFTFTITAPANTPYHVWLRLRSGADSKYNDSVFVQFSDAVDPGGNPVYRIGTTSGLLVNLQRCDGCALVAWGWVDGAYWLVQHPVLSFTSSGPHTIRVQTREDGVQFDEMVLSPAAYLVSSPGLAMNDRTRVLRTTGGSTPFSGVAAAIPGVIQAVNFDNGGEGVAYHDATTGNTGGVYRQTDVDLQASNEGGYNLAWMTAREWLEYTVNVASAGPYLATFRVASLGQGGTFHLEMNGTNVTGPITIQNTGAWQVWQNVAKTVALPAGMQTARLVMDTAGTSGAVGNIKTLTLARAGSTPYSGTPVSLPGVVQTEHFDNGGEGVGYHDTTSGNRGGAYRSTDVDLEPASAGGYDVAWVVAGEWLQYSLNVAVSAAYRVNFRVASSGQGGTFHLEMNGVNVAGPLVVPDTGGWQNWQVVGANVRLPAGAQVARLVMDGNGSTAAVGNFDTIEFLAGSSPPPDPGGGTIINVPAGGDLQAAINGAQAGDTILLAAGAVYRGSFLLPAKSGNLYVTIRSAAPDTTLPAAGVRVGPADAPRLAKIEGGIAGQSAFMTAAGAHHYRLQFLEIVSTYAANNIIQLGAGPSQTTLSSVPYDLIIDRCYIHGDRTNGQKRGIALNSASTTISNSYISDIKSSQEDSQAIAGWNGPGPFLIVNNYLEAAGENVLFGGGDPYIPNLVPSDITLQRNYISKPLAWRGGPWTIKNLIQLKNAQRVSIDGNLIENQWAAAQDGYAVVLTPRNQDGTAPWSIVQHVTFTNNLVRHVASVFNVLGNDDRHHSQTTNGITIRNNIFQDVSKAKWGGAGWLLLTNGGRNVTVDHNTVFTDGTSVVFADGVAVTGMVFTNNIVPDNAWAIKGAGTSAGNGTVAKFYPGGVFRRNVFIAGHSGTYPSDNYFPADVGGVGYGDVAGENYRLTGTSPYRASATDSTAIGADQSAIEALVPVR